MTMAPPRTLADFIDQAGGRTACLAMSRDPNAKVTILLFPPGAARPAYVAKVPTTDAAARSVEREAERLAEVGGRELGPVRATIPKLVATVEHLGRPVLVMTAMPGQSMLAAYHAWRHTARRDAVAADFAAAGDWLARLQQRRPRGDRRSAWRRCWTESRTCSAAGSAASPAPMRTWAACRPAGGWRANGRRKPWCTATSGRATC